MDCCRMGEAANVNRQYHSQVEMIMGPYDHSMQLAKYQGPSDLPSSQIFLLLNSCQSIVV
jgi:hypothetical protein